MRSADDADGAPRAVAETVAEPVLEKAAFAAGCFWGVENTLRAIPGVVDAVAGYEGGSLENPGYEDVCSGKTGHAETVELTFDPGVVGYPALLDAFFRLHDPTQLNRQGMDVGTQYRSAIFYHGEEQARQAREAIERLNVSGRLRRPVATALVPASRFWRAEEYHQRYYDRGTGIGGIFASIRRLLKR